MASTTPNFGLRKPSGIDQINVDSDLNNNYDIIDLNLKAAADNNAAATSQLLTRSRLEISSTNVALTTDTLTTILTLNGGAPLPVGKFHIDLWFAVRYAADPPTSLEFKAISSVARDWIAFFGPTNNFESGTTTEALGATTLTMTDLKVPNTAAGGLLYKVQIASPSINPSGTMQFQLETNSSVDTTLLNLAGNWTVRD